MGRPTVAMLLADKQLFLSKLVRDGECLRWSGAKSAAGYGRLSSYLAHRLAYQVFHGSIPMGMTVDHTYFVRDCCNPDHLRLMSHEANARNQRQALSAFCGAGHPRRDANVYIRTIRGRVIKFCKACNLLRVREYAERQRRLRGKAA